MPRTSRESRFVARRARFARRAAIRSVIKRIRARLPRGLKQRLKPAYLLWLDLVDLVSGHRRRGLPPTRIMLPQYGRRDPAVFHEVGRWFVNDLVATCGLRPDQALLDVGCGAGRIGNAMADFMSPAGSYDGFDVDRKSIAWASRHIASRHPHLRFRFVDVANRQYNPGGTIPPEEFRFPYEADSFDVCFLHSVFTHMLPDNLRRYVAELRRVLRPGGAAYVSYYLYDEEARRCLEARPDLPLRFEHSCGEYRTIDPSTPEYSVAYDEGFIRRIYAEAGLLIDEPVRRGGWCGRNTDRHQDVVVARKAMLSKEASA